MMNLEELKKNNDLINQIDWDMTHEEAVRLYLEWGNNWAGGNYVIRSKDDVSYYFVVQTLDNQAKIILIRRNSEDAEELAEIEMPEDMNKRFLDSTGHKGVYPVDADIKNWLKKQLYEEKLAEFS